MSKTHRKVAPTPKYISPNQLTLAGFETPFERKLNPENRWVVLGHLIPWDEICNIYAKIVKIKPEGRPPLSPRLVLGSIIIKHICHLDDRETVAQISENVYMQYFLGFTSFSDEAPFDPSLFVKFRNKLGLKVVNTLNERIVALKAKYDSQKGLPANHKTEDISTGPIPENLPASPKTEETPSDPIAQDLPVNPIFGEKPIVSTSQDLPSGSVPGDGPVGKTTAEGNKGQLMVDATVCPQDIAYPTDLNLLSEAREMSEHLVDLIYDKALHKKKPRTYREVARQKYLKTAQKKNKSGKVVRKAVGEQLRHVARNLQSINTMLDSYTIIPFEPKEYKYFLVITTLYGQQKQMYDTHCHSIDDRIVSIHQPHVRPIVRGKSQAKVEFGAKIHVSLVDGIAFLDELSWDAFNEGSHMMVYIENYKRRFGFYPKEVLADQIYCTRANRAALKEKGIALLAKPLGRPSAVSIHLRPGERNPIEGKFGQAKTGYGLNRIKARLKGTSESWIASIILVLNLVKLAGAALLCQWFGMGAGFSAKGLLLPSSTVMAISNTHRAHAFNYGVLTRFNLI